MARFSLDNTTQGNSSTLVTDYSVDSMNVDSATGEKEFRWQCSKASQYWGYVNRIPELFQALNMKAIWTVGKGYETDTRTQVILEHITGNGKDTFLDILFNMEFLKRLYGDAYAEIIRDSETGELLNLKVLDTGTIVIISDEKGIIKRYEQMTNTPGSKPITFKPEEILHFSNNRLSSQVHGISVIDALEDTILADAESFSDTKKLSHRQARPMIVFKLGTNNQSEITAFASKMDMALKTGDNLYIPFDDKEFSYEVVQTPLPSQIFDWRAEIRSRFYRALGLPLVIFGSANGSTESGSKSEVFAHEMVWEKDQLQIEKQLLSQLNIDIDLLSPPTMLGNLTQDASKDGAMQGIGMQPNDVMAGVGQ
jgi:hypothetical protein